MKMSDPAEFLLIRDQYELAFHILERGLSAEEAGHKSDALLYYRKCLQHLNQGVGVPTEGDKFQGQCWDNARQVQQKMRSTIQTVTSRMYELETLLMNLPQNCYPDLGPYSQPPNSSLLHLYPSVPATNHGTSPVPPPRPPSPNQPPAYTPRPTVQHSLYYDANNRLVAVATNERELIHIPAGVQMFFVAPNGQVSSLFSPGFLRIFTMDSKETDSEQPSAFLHVCEWLYPLTHDTPVLLANSGIYMFPDTLTTVPGTFVGIVLSSDLPTADQELFQDVLAQIVEFRIQVSDPEGIDSEVINLSQKVPLLPPRPGAKNEEEVKPPLPKWSEKMAERILHGATWLSEEFIKGADATSRAIHRSGFKIRDRITPEETPSEVSPKVTKGLEAAQTATGGAVRFSKFLVDGVSTVAGHVADKVVPHVKKHGSKLVPESLKSKDGRPSKLDGAKHVAASSVQGFSTLWSSLEAGAKLVGKSVTAETVTTVKYKYGMDAGEATDTALKSVINIGVTAYNIDNLGIKAIMKTAGKTTAKAMVVKKDGKELEWTKTQSPQTETEAKDTQTKLEEEEENK
uniref:MIT domain-containing protein n=1 Tax=Periophthalmus magnuspinnatus TaxID=409849 RepID=A0A3B4B0W4_9GOBI